MQPRIIQPIVWRVYPVLEEASRLFSVRFSDSGWLFSYLLKLARWWVFWAELQLLKGIGAPVSKCACSSSAHRTSTRGCWDNVLGFPRVSAQICPLRSLGKRGSGGKPFDSISAPGPWPQLPTQTLAKALKEPVPGCLLSQAHPWGLSWFRLEETFRKPITRIEFPHCVETGLREVMPASQQQI